MTVNEYTSNWQFSNGNYIHTTAVVRNKRLAFLKVYFVAKDHFLKNIFLFFIACFQTLLYHFKNQVKTILDLQKKVVLCVNNLISDYLFFYKSRFHLTTIHSSLYRVA